MSLIALAALVGWGLAIILAAFLVSFLPGYMKKKGENLASHEDIKLLTDQVAAVTQTAKEIEAKISSEVWEKQRRWELKQDVLFEATKRLAALDDALQGYNVTLRVGGDWNESKQQLLDRWGKASTAYDETRLFVSVVCAKETKEAFDNVGRIATATAVGIGKKDAGIYDKSHADFFKAILAARQAVRKELSIDGSV